MLSRIQVRGRLLLAFFAIASFAVLAAAAALYSFLQVGGALNLITEERVPSALASQELSRQAERIVAVAPALLAVVTDEQHARASAEIAAEVARLDDLLAEVRRRSVDAPMMDSILGNVQRMEANLAALDALVANRLAAGARKRELLRQLADVEVASQRLLGPGILALEADALELRRVASQPNLSADARAEMIERMVASIAEAPQLQRARAEASAINQALVQAASASSSAELQVLTFPLHRSLGTLESVARELDEGLGSRVMDRAREFRALIEEPDSIPSVRDGELAIVADIEDLLARNAEVSALLTGALDQLVAAANEDIKEANLDALAVQRASTAILAIVVGLSLASSILIVWLYVGRNLIARLTSLNHSMMAIAGGRLDAKIPTGGSDEISDMAKALTVFRDTAVEVRETNLHELQTARTRLADAIESISGGFVVYGADGRLLLCNTKYREIYPSMSDLAVPGTTFESLIRASIERDLVKDVIDVDEWVAQRLARHASPQGAFDQEQVDGRWLQINERRTEDGGTVIEYSDITGRKHAEIELVRAKEEAEDATRMKSRFLANMSHELRTPLTSIKGSLSLIASGTAGEVPNDVATLIGIADESAGSLVGLINDILDFEKIRAGQLVYDFESLDLKRVVEQAVDANRAYGDQFGIRFRLRASDAANVRINGDRNRLIQLLNNLLSNAAKYSPKDGEVEVSIERRDAAVRVNVRDKGPGIPKEVRENMFGEFYQVYEKGADRPGGTGLGLSIAKSIVESHGGSIDYTSEADVGSTFFFDLPALGGDTQDTEQRSAESARRRA